MITSTCGGISYAIYLFRYCIICVDKILPGEIVKKTFSLTDSRISMI
jgi:hypothetical protein